MDFTTTTAAPVAITIDGTPYQLPRFLIAAFKAWAAAKIKQQKDEGLALLSTDEDRAKFTYFYGEPLFDIAGLVQFATTPEGAEYVVDAQMKLAGVPDDVREKALAAAQPMSIRTMASQLLQAPAVLAAVGAEETRDPLPSAPVASAGSPATGSETKAEPEPSTASST